MSGISPWIRPGLAGIASGSTGIRSGCVSLWMVVALSLLTSLLVTVTASHVPVHPIPDHAGLHDVDWAQTGQQDLMTSLKWWPTWTAAKNVIFFLGDGMGLSTQTAARFFRAQRESTQIHDVKLAWDEFPIAGTVKTYNTNQQVGDSAACANAFLSGEKSQSGVIGYNQKVTQGICADTTNNELKSLIHHAMDQGKRTGVVSTTRITHASVAAAYAHSPHRDWEVDSEIPAEEAVRGCRDIAYQMVHGAGNKDITVLLGGGRRNFLSENVTDAEHPGEKGRRADGLDLVQDWLDIKKNDGLTDDQYKYVTNSSQFNDVDPSKVDHLLGLFEPSHMNFEAERADDVGGEPSLTEMVEKALSILSRGDQGFFLYVEGGRIDHGHHFNQAQHALTETLQLDDAVRRAMELTDVTDTLYVVTADHSHTFTIGGYQNIDNDILGVVRLGEEETLAYDGKPLLTLHYGNGPGFYPHRTANGSLSTEIPRKNLTGIPTNATDYRQDASLPFAISTHAGEDVAVFAHGPMSHLFTGVHEQHYLAHAMGYITCIGSNREMCTDAKEPPGCPSISPTGGATTCHRGRHELTYIMVLLALCQILATHC